MVVWKNEQETFNSENNSGIKALVAIGATSINFLRCLEQLPYYALVLYIGSYTTFIFVISEDQMIISLRY